MRGMAITQSTQLTADFVKGMESREILICDLDGTLANGDHRLPYILKDKKDWTAYYRFMERDVLVRGVYDIVTAQLPMTFQAESLVILTGRPERFREVTEIWLGRNKIEYGWLVMRENGDKRENHVYKRDILQQLQRCSGGISLFVDDNLPAVKAAYELGLRFMLVGGPENCSTGGFKDHVETG